MRYKFLVKRILVLLLVCFEVSKQQIVETTICTVPDGETEAEACLNFLRDGEFLFQDENIEPSLFPIENFDEDSTFPLAVKISDANETNCLGFTNSNQAFSSLSCSSLNSSTTVYINPINEETEEFSISDRSTSICLAIGADLSASSVECSDENAIKGFIIPEVLDAFIEEAEPNIPSRVPGSLPTRAPIGVNSPFGTRFKNIYTSIVIIVLSFAFILAVGRYMEVPDSVHERFNSVKNILQGRTFREKNILENIKRENNLI